MGELIYPRFVLHRAWMLIEFKVQVQVQGQFV